MERKKRSKGRGWESCYVKKIYGTFGVRAEIGQILQTHASPLVVGPIDVVQFYTQFIDTVHFIIK